MTTPTFNRAQLEQLGALIDQTLQGINVTDENQHAVLAAVRTFGELMALLTMAGSGQWPFRKELQPLSNQVTEFIRAVEKRINVPLPDVSAEELEPMIQERENCNLHLEHARQTSISLLTHLSLAINISEPRRPPNLKAV